MSAKRSKVFVFNLPQHLEPGNLCRSLKEQERSSQDADLANSAYSCPLEPFWSEINVMYSSTLDMIYQSPVRSFSFRAASSLPNGSYDCNVKIKNARVIPSEDGNLVSVVCIRCGRPASTDHNGIRHCNHCRSPMWEDFEWQFNEMRLNVDDGSQTMWFTAKGSIVAKLLSPACALLLSRPQNAHLNKLVLSLLNCIILESHPLSAQFRVCNQFESHGFCSSTINLLDLSPEQKEEFLDARGTRG